MRRSAIPESVQDAVVLPDSGAVARSTDGLGLRAWAGAIARAAFDLGVGPLAVVAAVERFVVWPLAFGITAAAALALAIPLGWARVRFGPRLENPWLISSWIALTCVLTAQPWWLRTGWPIALGCGLLFATEPAARARQRTPQSTA